MTARDDQALEALRELDEVANRECRTGDPTCPCFIHQARAELGALAKEGRYLRAMEALCWAHERMAPHVPSLACHVCARLSTLADAILEPEEEAHES